MITRAVSAVFLLLGVSLAMRPATARAAEEVQPVRILVIEKNTDVNEAWRLFVEKLYYRAPRQTNYFCAAVPANEVSKLVEFDSPEQFTTEITKFRVAVNPNVWRAVDTALKKAEELVQKNQRVVLHLFVRDAEEPVPAGIKDRLRVLDNSGLFELALYESFNTLGFRNAVKALKLNCTRLNSKFVLFDEIELTGIAARPLVSPGKQTTFRVLARVGRYVKQADRKIEIEIGKVRIDGDPTYAITPLSVPLEIDEKSLKDDKFDAAATFTIKFDNLRTLAPGTPITGTADLACVLKATPMIRGLYAATVKNREYPLEVWVATRKAENAQVLKIDYVRAPEVEVTGPEKKILKLAPTRGGSVPLVLTWHESATKMKLQYAFKTDDPENVEIQLTRAAGERPLVSASGERTVELLPTADGKNELKLAVAVKVKRRGRYTCSIEFRPLSENLGVKAGKYSFTVDATTIIGCAPAGERVVWKLTTDPDGKSFWTARTDRLVRLTGDEASESCTLNFTTQVQGANEADVKYLVNDAPARKSVEWRKGKTYDVGIDARVPLGGGRLPGNLELTLEPSEKFVSLKTKEAGEAARKVTLEFVPAVESTVLDSGWHSKTNPDLEITEFAMPAGAVSTDLVLRLTVVEPLPLTFEKTVLDDVVIEAVPPENRTPKAAADKFGPTVRKIPVRLDASRAAPGEKRVVLKFKSGAREFSSGPLKLKMSGYLVKPRLDAVERAGAGIALHSVDTPSLGKLNFNPVSVNIPTDDPSVRLKWVPGKVSCALLVEKEEVTETGTNVNPRFGVDLTTGFGLTGNAVLKALARLCEASPDGTCLLGTIVLQGVGSTHVASKDEPNRLSIPVHVRLRVPTVSYKALGRVELKLSRKSDRRCVLNWPKDFRYLKLENADLMNENAQLRARLTGEQGSGVRVSFMTSSGQESALNLRSFGEKRLPPLVLEGARIPPSGKIVFDSDAAIINVPPLSYRPAPLVSLGGIVFVLVLIGLAVFAYVKLKAPAGAPKPRTVSITDGPAGIFSAPPAAKPVAGDAPKPDARKPKRDFDIFGDS